MKVKELIEKLQQQDPEKEAMILDNDEYFPVEEVKTQELTRWDDDEMIDAVVIN